MCVWPAACDAIKADIKLSSVSLPGSSIKHMATIPSFLKYMGCLVCICICVPCVCTLSCQKRAPDLPEMELQVAGSCHVGAGNQIRILSRHWREARFYFFKDFFFLGEKKSVLKWRSRRDGCTVKSTDRSSRKTTFNSQHPRDSSQPSVAPVPEIPRSSSFCGHQVHT